MRATARRARAGRAPATSAALAGLFAVFFASGCEPSECDPRPVLLYAADNQGVLAACGCPSNPTGGLAKRQGLVEQYRASRRHVLVIDAGNVMPDHANLIKVKYLAKALAKGGCDAIALGEQEFLLGRGVLRDLQETHGLPLICANVRTDAGETVAPPHVIRTVEGRRVGIFAVIADGAWGFPVREWREGLTVEPPEAAARRETKALADCDLVVALVHQSVEECEELARNVPGLDVVVAGRGYHPLRTPRRIGETLLVCPGPAGRVLGCLTFEPQDEGQGVRLVHDMTVLSARIPEAPWVLDLYWKYVEESKEAPPPDWNETPIPTRYEPSEACKECHEKEYAQWATTAHAQAYESIQNAGRHRDPECVLCHTMGLGRKGGFVSMKRTPGLGRVTCQGCHVVTSDHAEKGVKPEPRYAISSRLCMSCHGPVQSPEFDYFQYKPKILHTIDRENRTGK